MKFQSSICIILVLLAGCGPAAKLRRAEKLIKKAEEQGAVWRVDTVRVEVPVFIKETSIDSIFISKPGDTVVLHEDRLKVKYVRLPGDSVYIEGVCEADTVYKSVPVTITKTIHSSGGIRWWWLIVAAAAGILLASIVRLIR